MKLANNECTKCNYQWLDAPGALAKYSTCPKCGSKYWKWLNYEKTSKTINIVGTNR